MRRFNKKKRLFSFTAVLLAVMVQISCLAPFAVSADTAGSPWNSPVITGVRLTDAKGNPLGDKIPKNSPVSVVYDFSIPNGASTISPSYSFQLPKEISLYNGISQDLKDSEGLTAATVAVTADGKGTITFDQNYTGNHSNVGGTFTLGGYFSVGDDENTTPVTVSFPVDGRTDPYTVDVIFQQPDAANAKTGSYDAASGTVTWTVKLNTNKTTIQTGGIFTDDIAPGKTGTADRSQTYVPGSFKVTGGDGTVLYDGNAAAKGTFAYTPAAADDTSKTGTLNYTFADSFSDTRTVTFQTRVADPSQYFGKSVPNTASFRHDGLSQTASGSADVPTPNYIAKSGTYNEKTQQLDWTVKFNNDGYSLHGVKITDALPGGLTLDGSSVKVNGTAVSPGSTAGTYSYTGGTLVYNAGDISAQQTLTFSTNLPADYWQQNHGSQEFQNKAFMTSNDNSYLGNGAPGTSNGVGVGNSVVSKTGKGYDGQTHRISWEIVVNANQQNLPDASITDTIPAGQRYLSDTFAITPDKVNTETGASAFGGTLPADPSKSATVLTYHFGAISGTYTITYQTEVTDPAVWAGNTNRIYTDKATLDPGNGGPASEGNGKQPVSKTVLAKAAQGYDYTTHEISWQIVVNQDKIPLTNAVVTDVLKGNGMDDFTLEPETIQLNGAAMKNDNGTPPADGTYSYDAGTKALVFHLGSLNGEDLSARVKTITFKTKLNQTGSDYNQYFGANGDKSIDNTASLTTAENPAPTNSTGTQTIHNKLVEKTGSYTSGKAYIDWAVELNQNRIRLDNLKLTDSLQEGLELDTSSVKLYKQATQPDGSFLPAPVYHSGTLSVDGTPTALTKDNIAYDAATRQFVFTMPDQVITGPYLLTFRTTVKAAYANTTFSNSISFNGMSSGQQSNSGNTPVGFSSSDGKAWGEAGNVTVLKADKATGAGLSGAVFTLYDQYGNAVRISDPTDGSGKTSFDHLVFNVPFQVRETKAPANYEMPKDPAREAYTFELNADGKVQLLDASGTPAGDPLTSLTFQDTRKTGTVTFAKTDENGAGLAGATFTLFDSAGKPVTIDGKAVTAISSQSGLVTFGNIPYGTYQIRETSAPADYSLSSQTITADLTDRNPAVVSGTLALDANVQNSRETAGIRLTKLGAGGAMLQGATFTLYDAAGKYPVVSGGSPVTAASDAQGLVSFQSIPYGDYTLVETEAPADYAATAPIAVSLHDGNPAISGGILSLGNITDTLKTGTVTFTKTDGNGTGLAGAVFVLKDAAGNPVGSPQTSGKDGQVTFTDVPYGDGYSITETKAPADFGALDAPITGIDLHAPAVTLKSVADSRLTGSISFTKVTGTGEPLAGAEFILCGPDGNPVGSAQVSGRDGRVVFQDVPFRDGYTVREIKAPENYAIHGDFAVNLHTAAYDCGNVVDELLRGTITVKKSDPDGSPLGGATFSLFDGSGKEIGTAVSDPAGTASFADVLYGDYTVKETAAPAGYELDPAAYSVSLSAENPSPVVRITDGKIPSAPSEGGAPAVPKSPKTGDAILFPMAAAGLLAAVSGAAALLLGRKKRRPEKP